MSFVAYDLFFLALFTIFVIVFLYTRKHNLKRQGIMYLYRTKFGLEVIEDTSKRFAGILRASQYLVVACGYVLMAVMVWTLAKFTYIYTFSEVAQQIKVPPLLPLFPYATDLFKVDFLPPFYFTYWIIVIAIIAISHEFAHGIYARLNNIKVKATGFGFLGPFLAAFVEPDEKQMAKAKKFPQLAILAAGTFANVLMTILFALLLWAFFAVSFTPAGVTFNMYSTTNITIDSISEINGIPVTNLDDSVQDLNASLARLTAGEDTYLIDGVTLQKANELGIMELIVFEDAPAINAGLHGAITEVDGIPVTGFMELGEIIRSRYPGQTIEIKTITDEGEQTVNVTLAEKNGAAYLGIGIVSAPRGGISGFFYNLAASVKNPNIYYVPSWDGDLAWFIYNLLWWIVVINLSVALVNMLPVGIFDGGRFFYLTVWGITGKETWAKKSFKFMTWLFIVIAIWLMVRWAFAVF